MKELLSYRISPREETIVTLYDTGFIEIDQTPPPGEFSFPVRIDTEDIALLQDLLDRLRRYKGSEPETPAQQAAADMPVQPAMPTKPKAAKQKGAGI